MDLVNVKEDLYEVKPINLHFRSGFARSVLP